MRSVKYCTFVPLSSVFFYFDFSRTSANGQLSIRDSYDRRAVYRKPHFLLQKVTKLDSYRALLVPVSVSLINLDLYLLNKRFLKKIVAPPKKTGVVLYRYLPTTTTPLQRPLSSVPKMTVVKRFDWSLDATEQHGIS